MGAVFSRLASFFKREPMECTTEGMAQTIFHEDEESWKPSNPVDEPASWSKPFWW